MNAISTLEIMFFLSSGLFLGWSLGANDAANIFGTAVSSKMIRFKTAALICSLLVIAGAVWGGTGASKTLESLGHIHTMAGAFSVALTAGLTVTWMTALRLPVSTSHAIVGSIIGWNFFMGQTIKWSLLTKIVSSWVMGPFLALIFALLCDYAVSYFMKKQHTHLLRVDSYIRVGLIVVGAFGSYTLGANNIANVMGIFAPVIHFQSFHVAAFEITKYHQIFFLGGIAIAAGVYTYSERVMGTVGNGLFKLNPLQALIAVFSSSMVLFIFSSKTLSDFLVSYHLPAIPLVPVSSSQAIIGAVIGIGLAKGHWYQIHYRKLLLIAGGWVMTPLISGSLTFLILFFMQNVFLTKLN